MKPQTRITLGAAVGSLLVLLIHPVSRPFALCGMTQIGASPVLESSPLLSESFQVLPQPKTVLDASLWMQEGAERLVSRQLTSERNVESLILVAEAAQLEEPDNAFWPQMAAVFLANAGQRDKALIAWRDASRCNNWNDYQSARFATAKTTLVTSMRADQAWFNAAYYYRRSDACAFAIHRFGRSTLSNVGVVTPEDLNTRMIALRNGLLLRDNSRSVELGLFGVRLVEAASTTAKVSDSTPRKLISSRFSFIDKLRELKRAEDLEVANASFLDNDAWLALLLKENPGETMRDWSMISVLSAAAPSCFLIIAVIGYAFAGFGTALAKKPGLTFLVRSPVAPIFGLALSVFVFITTGFALFSLSIAGCFAFLALGPVKERTKPPDNFGPLFDVAVGAIALLFSVLVVTFLIGVTTPAVEVAPLIGVPEEYYGGQTLPLGLAVIALSLLFLLSPLWAISQRVSTTRVVVQAIRNFGFDVGVLCSFLGIATIPIAIYIDHQINPNMSKAMLNEPTFYLTR